MSYLRTGIAIVVAWALGVLAGHFSYGMFGFIWWLPLIILCPIIVGLIAARWHFIPCILVNLILQNTLQGLRSEEHNPPDVAREAVWTGMCVIAIGVSVAWSLVFAWIMKLKRDASSPAGGRV